MVVYGCSLSIWLHEYPYPDSGIHCIGILLLSRSPFAENCSRSWTKKWVQYFAYICTDAPKGSSGVVQKCEFSANPCRTEKSLGPHGCCPIREADRAYLEIGPGSTGGVCVHGQTPPSQTCPFQTPKTMPTR